MNNLLKDCKIRTFKVTLRYQNIRPGDQLLKREFLKTLIFKVLCFLKMYIDAQFDQKILDSVYFRWVSSCTLLSLTDHTDGTKLENKYKI